MSKCPTLWELGRYTLQELLLNTLLCWSWGESESFSSFVSVAINLSNSRCLLHLDSSGPLNLTDIPSTDRARQSSWRGVEATTSVRESTITHRECTCCGPSTKNREPLCQLGYVLGGARWRLPTGSLLLQVDLERGRASYWVVQLFKCKFISWTTRHYFNYLEIYLVRGKHPTSAYIFERKCRSYISNHQVWGYSIVQGHHFKTSRGCMIADCFDVHVSLRGSVDIGEG